MVRDEARAYRELAAAGLQCPACPGRLKPWGYARLRSLRLHRGKRVWLRPRRARCQDCPATHVLLPASCLPRRADAVEVVGSALLAKVCGQGHRTIAADLGLPAATVRGWIRRATARAHWLRVEATLWAHRLDSEPGPMPPTGSALGDALDALSTGAAAAVRRLGRLASPWQTIAVLTRGQLLTPLPSG